MAKINVFSANLQQSVDMGHLSLAVNQTDFKYGRHWTNSASRIINTAT